MPCLLRRYGELIVTVGLVGEVQVSLEAAKREAIPRHVIPTGVDVGEGGAYAIWGDGRHKYKHRVWCPNTSVLHPECAISGTEVPARVGLTCAPRRLPRRPSATAASPHTPPPGCPSDRLHDAEPERRHIHGRNDRC